MTSAAERMARAFDALSGDYDDAHHDMIASELTDWLAPTHDEAVADVACGTGAVALAVARRRQEPRPATPVLAIDLSAGMVAAGQARAERAAVAGSIDWRVGPAVPLPVADDSLDLVLCASSLHFLGSAALADWRRAVRPGGRIGFSLPLASGFRPGGVFADLVAADLALPGTAGDAVRLAGTAGLAAPAARELRLGARAVVLVRGTVPGAPGRDAVATAAGEPLLSHSPAPLGSS
ncbi:class I SAM-dependent methyltransferase [Streptomyces sp. NPDC048018]|uniref:class I SAM-dependent methyltransferase n=1 Tax=Streptomyces sp. NPDC048018 TaxID=3365499 RepID=UPI003714557E